MHPYSGLFLFIVVPFLVASGAGAAWIAYLIWCDLSRARRAPAEDMVARV
jgi:hypothetical protein